MLIKKFGALNELTQEHLEKYFCRDLSMIGHLIPIDSYIDRPKLIKEEIELLKKATKFIADKKINRLASSHIGMKPEEFTMRHSIMSGNRTFTAAMRDSPSKTGKSDKPWQNSAIADMWPVMETRPLTALMPMNKKSIMKSQYIEDYPYRPAFIDSPRISTRGMIGEGYQISRPVQIESKRFNIFNAGQHDLSPEREYERSQKLVHDGLQKNSTTVWMDEYSNLGKQHVSDDDEMKKSSSTVNLNEKSSPQLEKIKAMEKTLTELADREEIIERNLASVHGSQASLKNLGGYNISSKPRTVQDVFYHTVSGTKSLAYISEDPKESTTSKLNPTEAGIAIGQMSNANIGLSSMVELNETRAKHIAQNSNINLGPVSTVAIQGDFTKNSLPSFSECCAKILHFKRMSEKAAGEMIVGMTSNLYNLYQVIKRRSDANFFTKRDLQLLLSRLGIECNILVSDTLYDILDHGKDGVVCFSDFERALLPRDNNVLNVSRKSTSKNYFKLDSFEQRTINLFQQSLSSLVQVAETLNIMRRDYWREMAAVKKSSTASLRDVTRDRLGSSSVDELEFVKKIISCH